MSKYYWEYYMVTHLLVGLNKYKKNPLVIFSYFLRIHCAYQLFLQCSHYSLSKLCWRIKVKKCAVYVVHKVVINCITVLYDPYSTVMCLIEHIRISWSIAVSTLRKIKYEACGRDGNKARAIRVRVRRGLLACCWSTWGQQYFIDHKECYNCSIKYTLHNVYFIDQLKHSLWSIKYTWPEKCTL